MIQNEPSYQAALDYLYSFVDYSLSKTFRYDPVKFDLARMDALMEILGQPQKEYPIIHIAGTKGKGSVTAMCASVLKAQGYKVGMYTSPHLQDYAERIQVDLQNIPHEHLVELVEEVKPKVESVPELTTFEITTALGLLYFSRRKVDVAVVEVGLGGRLDATNVVTPVVSVITSLSYDHMFLLGNTLAEIAAEKGGIIKPGVPIVLSPQEDEARLVVEKIAAEKAAPLIRIGHDYRFNPISHTLESQKLKVWATGLQGQVEVNYQIDKAHRAKPIEISIPLLGRHQIENAVTAYATLDIFRKRSLPVSDEALRKGFSSVSWPGRFEILQSEPPVVVDSAHNRDSALKLRQALDDYFPGRPVLMVFGASEDKDLHGMFAELAPRVHEVIATRSFHPRAMDPEYIVDMARQYGKPARIVADVAEALNEALEVSRKKWLVLVTGSLFVVAGARQAWQARKENPLN